MLDSNNNKNLYEEDILIIDRLSKIRSELSPPLDFDNTNCESCSNKIQDERLKLYSFRCYFCQELYEKSNKR